MHEFVILVDDQNNEIGVMEKQEAHEKALLHRAFSVFIFNDKRELLLQQRALTKYHSAGLWTNTCCSHPRIGEQTKDAAQRRLKEEMGIETPLLEKGTFIYKAAFDNGLTEHELDFIYTGTYNHAPIINTQEVNAYRWLSLEKVQEDIALYPDNYTVWFKIILEHYVNNL
ncbi:MAG: isopentenyl-diphosphate Delta-isomerase [Bacteroidetes bacterium]|nr:MAG: isopentenyl-diphosphate Delta-isomerase [Bacteroidota bacterium]